MASNGNPSRWNPIAFGIFERADEGPRVGLRWNEAVVDLAAVRHKPIRECVPDADAIFGASVLNPLMALGAEGWRKCFSAIRAAIESDEQALDQASFPVDEVALLLPFDVDNFIDFYASRYHAAAAGSLMRPGSIVPAHWPYVPIGYHSRATSIVVSGEPVARPRGQFIRNGGLSDRPVYAETERLDFELELGFVVGAPSDGSPVPPDRALDHVFGAVLLNDWSARDIQALEGRPLGPFLGKSFATSIGPWVVPIEELLTRRVPAGPQQPSPLEHLQTSAAPLVFDLELEAVIRVPGADEPQLLCRTNARHLYWCIEQQVAHLTASGVRLCTGDLLGTGTISGPTPDSGGCLLELTANGARPIRLPNGTLRGYLEDGDEVVLKGEGFGSLVTRVVPTPHFADVNAVAAEGRES